VAQNKVIAYRVAAQVKVAVFGTQFFAAIGFILN
jgi:hypothetical protein